jgi:hypothetical protein
MSHRLIRSFCAATALLLLADGLAAQGRPAVRLIPQAGTTIHHSRGVTAASMGALAVEVPVWRGVSLTAEGTAALRDHPPTIRCNDAIASCWSPMGIRSGYSAGVMVHPFRIGPVAPYAGVSAGRAQWVHDVWSGDAPMASYRAGLDVRVAGPLGVRADLARRVVWSDESGYSALRSDVLSVGASFSLGR